jgi:FlaA1/EpsC-like NDP-sugar epimerase
VALDCCTTRLARLEDELGPRNPETAFELRLGDIRDASLMDEILAHYEIDIVFHAAGRHHAPLAENNPIETAGAEILGSSDLAGLCARRGLRDFVFLSSEDAVCPRTLLAACRLLAERLILRAASMPGAASCRFSVVRLGNILGSSYGPLVQFDRQLDSGKPVTVSHPDSQARYMNRSEAARLILQAAALAQGGETFVADAAHDIRLLDLATQVIRWTGLEPEHDVEIAYGRLTPTDAASVAYTGTVTQQRPSAHPNLHYVGEDAQKIPSSQDSSEIREFCESRDVKGLLQKIAELTPGWQPLGTAREAAGSPDASVRQSLSRLASIHDASPTSPDTNKPARANIPDPSRR